jgi:rubrerythrin
MIDVPRRDAPEQGHAVDFHAAGDRAKGEFRCSGCGYGVAIVATLPNCPMCGGDAWQRGPWRPFTRAEPLHQ